MSEFIRWNIHEGNLLETKDEFKVLDCDKCGFAHLIPIPSIEELDRIYREEYYTEEKPDYISKTQEDIEWWNCVYDERFDIFESSLTGKQRRVLEIGSGSGYFLKRAQQRGWIELGIEPNKIAFEYSKELGVNVKNGVFDSEISSQIGEFGVVHLNEVLEHVPNPIEIIKLLKNNLIDNGLICIMAPNDFNPLQEVAQKQHGLDSWWVAPPHHINYFNVKSLSAVLEKSGFQVVHKTVTFPIDMFLLMGDNYVGKDDMGRKCHSKRKTFENNLMKFGKSGLKQKLYEKFAEVGIGREVVITAKKIK